MREEKVYLFTKLSKYIKRLKYTKLLNRGERIKNKYLTESERNT